jgi:hypothetical protein
MWDGMPHDDVLLSPPRGEFRRGLGQRAPTKLFLLHVPKTAGSTLNHLCSELSESPTCCST